MAHADNLAAGNFLVPNATFIVELLAFLIILGVLAKFVLPRIQAATTERRRMVEQQVRDTEAATQRLVQAQQAYQDALHDARVEASKIREEARAEGQRTVEELRASAQEESARIVARGEEQLAAQRVSIVRQLRAEVGTLAVELSEKIVDQPLASEADVTATVDSFLAGLTAEDDARSGAGS